MSKRFASLLVTVVLAAPLTLAQTSTWVPDKAHSAVHFSVLHMGLANVRGGFGNITGTIVLNDADITKSTVNVTIDTTTIETGVAPRDADLKSGHFFDVAQFPTATFVSTGITKTSDGLTIAGNLTLHGVTKPVTLQAVGPNGPKVSMDKKTHMGFTATTTIRRNDFGIAPQYPPAMIGDDIQLIIDLDIAKQ
jgi:polyisoprenoid-binding protein YceI